MSDRVGIKPKDTAGKKFSSLNLNQTYKGTKVEPKTTAGIPRHGLQSLGKVAVTRRMPPPANLPSLKSENLGNDPTVALVPSGGGGWGSAKEKEATTTTTTTTTPAVQTAAQTVPSSQQQAQQPLKPTEPSQKPATATGQQPSTTTGQTTSTNQTSGTSTRTWASSSSGAGGQERTSYPRPSQNFNREFPILGGGNSGDRPPEERVSLQPYGQPPRNMHDPPWMDKGGGPPPRPSFGMHNGSANQGPLPKGGYDSHGYHRDGHPPGNYQRPESNEMFPYMGQTRPANYPGHAPMHRDNVGPRHAAGPISRHMVKMEESPSGYVRPSILKEDDIKAMDAEDLEDGGWAGAQEEIDYSVKLNFDDDEPPSPVDEKDGSRRELEGRDVSRQDELRAKRGDESRELDGTKPAPRQAWSRPGDGGDHQQWNQQQAPYNQKRPWGTAGHHQQQRPPPPSGPSAGALHQQDGRRNEYHGGPPESPERLRQREQQRIAIEHARQRKEQEELERRRHQEAAAQEKLKMLEAKKRQLHIATHDGAVRDQSGPRSPLSPAGSDIQVRRIMSRKDSGSTGDDEGSVKSVESVGKDEKKESRKTDQQSMTKDQPQEPRDQLRKTSSSEAPVDGKSSRLEEIKEEKKPPEVSKTKEKSEEKASVDKRWSGRGSERDVKPSKPARQTSDVDRRKPRDESVDIKARGDNKEQDSTQRDTRRRPDDSERTREAADRRGNERRRDEPNRKGDDVESNKENLDRGNDDRKDSRKYPESKSDRGSSESLRSRDNQDRRRDERKRSDDVMKRKRDDFERDDSISDRGSRDRGGPRERVPSGRGRPHLAGGKSSLRGHPKSYRRNSQRSRKDSKDYGDEDIRKSVPAEEKKQLGEKGEERRQTENERRDYQDSRSYQRDKRQTDRPYKDDRPYKGSGRFPPRGGDQADRTGKTSGRFPSRTGDQGDRGGKPRDKPRNRGGFGVPPPKPGELAKTPKTKTEDTMKAKEQQTSASEAKVFTAPPLESKGEGKDSKTFEGKESKTPEVRESRTSEDSGKLERSKDTRSAKEQSQFRPPVNNDWAVEQPESPKKIETDVRQTVEKSSDKIEPTRPIEKSAPTTKDISQIDRKAPGGNKQETRQPRDDTKSSGKDTKVSENEPKVDERGDRAPASGRRLESQGSRGFPRVDERTERSDSRGEPRRKQDWKSDERRDRGTQPREDTRRQQDTRRNEGRSRVDARGETRRGQESKSDERLSQQRYDSKSDGRRDQRGPRDTSRRDLDTKVGERRDRTENSKTRTQEGDRGESTQQGGETRQDSAKSVEQIDRADQRSVESRPSATGERFTIGSTGTERGRYSRRGGSRRGGRGSYSTRGRGRGHLHGSGRIPGRGSATSKDDDEDSMDSGKFHSAHSSVDTDESEDEGEVFSKSKPDSGRSHPSGGASRSLGMPRGRGRGRGSSPRSSRKLPPRFQKQDQARGASRGRGKSSRGQYPSKENWDDESGRNREKSNKNFEDGPLPKKRSPGNVQDSSGDRSSGVRGKKQAAAATRADQSGKRSSFLAKKQQEVVVEGARKTTRSGAGPKSTFSAAATQHGRTEQRRGKNDSAQDLDEIFEPPKKNPRRTEPTTIGIEHFDLSNIAGVIDIEDIPAIENEPASPHSDFVEVKSKRTQKELRDRAREEEDRKKRELEKLMADAKAKPTKPHKPSNQNKSHQSKPPRFSRSNNNLPANHVLTSARGSTPETVSPAVSPENVAPVTGIAPVTGDQKRASPLMIEKPNSPAPPPMFNAWTKPLSITPAKPHVIPPEMSTARPDPLAVGSGKPTRSTHPKSEEPGLQIQLDLPDTFQEMPHGPNMESQPDNSRVLIEDSAMKKTELETEVKTDSKTTPRPEEPSNEKNTAGGNEKRPTGGGKFARQPRVEKSAAVKRNGDGGRKYKTDVKEQGGDTKARPASGEPEKISKEQKTSSRPASTPRSRDLNKNLKPKPQPTKTVKSETENENTQPPKKDSQGNLKGNQRHEDLNKRDSVELDVRSISESLLDEPSLDVGMVETTEPTSGAPVMGKIKTEDDINMVSKMEEKMVAAKKAWDTMDTVSTSATMVGNSPSWKTSSVADNDNTEASETLSMDKIPRSTNEAVEETSEPLVTSPPTRLKKPTNGEQQNVCKVKPQQQQQPVKAQPVTTDVPDSDYPTPSSAIPRSRIEFQTQTSYSVPQAAAVFPSKVPQYPFQLDQQSQMLQYNPYVQTMPTVRPATLQPSVSPPQRSFAPPMSTPSPLSQPVLQDTYRALPGALYPTNYPSNQFFQIVRPTASPQSYQPAANNDVTSAVYALQANKTPTAGYDPTVAQPHPVYVPIDQTYVDQSQRQATLGFYPDNTNQATLGTNISHVQPNIFPQTEKRGQQHPSRENQSSHHDQYPPSAAGQSEMVKHVNAKPFQPPANTSPQNVPPQMLPPNRHMAAVPASVTPSYQMTNTAVSMPVGPVPGSSTVTTHSVTSSGVTHSMPVSRLSFQYAGQMPTPYQRHPVPVQSLTQPTYPTALSYRPSLPTYPSSSVGGTQPGVLVQKQYPATIVRQVVAPGRGTPISHRMPEPIQRPSKPGIMPGNPKEKLVNPQAGQKITHQAFGRRGFNQMAPMVATHQMVQQPPRQQQQQQQQMFRSQQHQLMLSGAQQFFAANKQMEMQQHRRPDQPKQREMATTGTDGSSHHHQQQQPNQEKRKQQQPKSQQETKTQKSKKDEQKPKPEQRYEKRTAKQQQERKDVRTAQIQPQRSQIRPQNRAKSSTQPKQQPVKIPEKLRETTQIEHKPTEKIESITEANPEVPATPLAS